MVSYYFNIIWCLFVNQQVSYMCSVIPEWKTIIKMVWEKKNAAGGCPVPQIISCMWHDISHPRQ